MSFAFDRSKASFMCPAISAFASLLLAIASPVAFGQTSTSYTEFVPPKSSLGQFADSLAKEKNRADLFALVPDGNILKPTFATNGNSSRQVLSAAANRVTGARGGSSSSSGGNSWSSSITGSKMSATAGFGTRYWNPTQEVVAIDDKSTFYLQLKENTEQQNFALVTAKPDKSFKIKFMGDNGAQHFRFSQSSKGVIRCVELGPEAQFSATANSFDEFAANYPGYLNQRLVPIMALCGAGEVPSRFHPFVRKYALFQLIPKDKEKLKQFEAMIEPMNDDDYSQREEATKAVNKNFDDWEPFIQYAMTNQDYSTEVRARLKKTYDKQVDSFRRGLLKLIAKSDLINDRDYLIWLLRSCEPDDVDSIKAISSQLAVVTNESFGNDTAQWLAWADERKTTDSVDNASEQPTLEQLLATKGELDDVSEAIGSMLRLQIIKGELTVDREHWKKMLGGKTIKEASAEVREFLKERNLPASWYQPGSSQYPENTVQFPQVVFDRVTSDLKPEANFASRMSAYSRYVFQTANRRFVGEKMNVNLDVHAANRQQMFMAQQAKAQKEIKQVFLNFDAIEKSGESRSIIFRDDLEGNLTCGIEFEKLNCGIRLVQKKEADKDGNRCYLLVNVGNTFEAIKMESFEALKRDHASDWAKYAPVFAKFGVIVADQP
ncbi:MAG: hypothetical protein AAFN77_18365 [Planctomycetota bacterium]